MQRQKTICSLFIVTVIICLAATVSFAQKKRTRGSAGDKLITALVNAEDVRGIWRDDAMYIFTNAPEIEKIFALGKRAIPLLIAHLDDKRMTNVALFNATGERQEEFAVTIGAACFDLLSYIIRQDHRFFDRRCLDDLEAGDESYVSACAKDEYAVFPQDFWKGQKQEASGVWVGDKLVVAPSVRRAKRNWQTAHRKGLVRWVKFEG